MSNDLLDSIDKHAKGIQSDVKALRGPKPPSALEVLLTMIGLMLLIGFFISQMG